MMNKFKDTIEKFADAFKDNTKSQIDVCKDKRSGYKLFAVVSGVVVVLALILDELIPALSSAITPVATIFLVATAVFIISARGETQKIKNIELRKKEIAAIAQNQENVINEIAQDLNLDVEDVKEALWEDPKDIYWEVERERSRKRRERKQAREEAKREKNGR